jgi:hypothetical protein
MVLRGTECVNCPAGTYEVNPCTSGYTEITGDILGWGEVGGRGGGEIVEDCAQCAEVCTSKAGCGSYECSLSTSVSNKYLR